MNPLTTCPKVAFWYSGLTLHAATANTVDGLSYDWQCMTGYEVAHQQLHRLWVTGWQWTQRHTPRRQYGVEQDALH